MRRGSARALERDAADPAHAGAASATLSDAVELLLDLRREQAVAGRRSPETVAFYEVEAGHLVRVFENAPDGKCSPFGLASLQGLARGRVYQPPAWGRREQVDHLEGTGDAPGGAQGGGAGRTVAGEPGGGDARGFAPEYRPRVEDLTFTTTRPSPQSPNMLTVQGLTTYEGGDHGRLPMPDLRSVLEDGGGEREGSR